MSQLKRYTTSHGTMCDAAEVADLEKKLEAYQDALDCIKDAMKYAASAIADPDSIAYVDLPCATEPYVKPKRYLVEPCGNLWGVRRRWSIEERYSSEPFQALDIPTREAAERIAAIYEEVMQ